LNIGNQILDCLPQSELERLNPHLKKTTLAKALEWKTGGESGRLYFPTAGLVSCMAATSKGEQLEVYAAGSTDVVGLIRTGDDSWHAKVRIPGDAAAISREDFERLLPRLGRFRELLCRYLAFVMARLTRQVACVRFHAISPRLCSWLAIATDLVQSTDLVCTQQSVADALGARRATVTVELGELQRRDIVRCERGKIRIIDRAALRHLTCDCFQLMHYDRLSTTA
jgi:CRP-like cAMP-binding protein